MFKKELKTVKASPQNPRKFFFQLNPNSTELELHKRTQEKSYLSALSVKSTILLDIRKKYGTKDKVLWSALSILPPLNIKKLTSGCMPSHL